MALEGSDENDEQVISLLTNGASKAMYLTYQCDMEIDKDKFRVVSKLFVFRDGLKMPASVNWASISTNAQLLYKSYATKYPDGSQCKKLKEQIAGIAFLLKTHLDLEY